MIGIEQLIEKIINELQIRKKKILVVCFGSNLEESIIYDLLEREYLNCQYEFVFSDAYKKNFDTRKWEQLGNTIETYDQNIQKRLQSFDLILIPYLTRNSLAKLAVGVADTDPLSIVLQCLLNGKQILASNHCWNLDTDNAAYRELNNNFFLKNLYEEYQANLLNMGVDSLPLTAWKEAVENFFEEDSPIKENKQIDYSTDKIFTLNDVKENPGNFKLSKNKMTDLAKEFLLDLQNKEE